MLKNIKTDFSLMSAVQKNFAEMRKIMSKKFAYMRKKMYLCI